VFLAVCLLIPQTFASFIAIMWLLHGVPLQT
jgi:hypothetical protein